MSDSHAVRHLEVRWTEPTGKVRAQTADIVTLDRTSTRLELAELVPFGQKCELDFGAALAASSRIMQATVRDVRPQGGNRHRVACQFDVPLTDELLAALSDSGSFNRRAHAAATRGSGNQGASRTVARAGAICSANCRSVARWMLSQVASRSAVWISHSPVGRPRCRGRRGNSPAGAMAEARGRPVSGGLLVLSCVRLSATRGTGVRPISLGQRQVRPATLEPDVFPGGQRRRTRAATSQG